MMRQWRRWGRWVVVGFVAASCLPGVARAESEVDILLDTLVANGTLTAVQAGQVRRQITETKEARNKQLAKEIVPDSSRNWKWSGDLRLRDEIRNRVGTGNDNHRQRIRFRYGFEGKVSDDLTVGARLATGTSTDSGASAESTATNQSLNTFFVKVPINLDLAYIQYTPEIPGVSKLSVIGGMMQNPLWTVGPMVWDPDLTWSGAAINLSQESGPVTFFTNDGVFSLDTDETEAAAIWTTQGGVSVMPFADSEDEVLKNFKITSALSYYDFMNVANSAKAGTDPTTRISTNTALVQDFNELIPSFEVLSQVAGVPMSLFGDWVRNVAAGSGSGNGGFQIGVKVGKAKNPWDLKTGWEAGYFFERLEENAVFDELTDSDFGGGGTNRRGNVWWVTLAVLKHSTVSAKFFSAKQLTGAKANEDRIQLDWMTKF